MDEEAMSDQVLYNECMISEMGTMTFILCSASA